MPFRKKRFFILFLAVFVCLAFRPVLVSADSKGQTQIFLVEKDYDASQREKVESVLEFVSENGYFYLETLFKSQLSQEELGKIDSILENLGKEFDEIIYPKLTSLYGSEWKNGIDRDPKITILFHQLRQGAAGYFKESDEYPKQQAQNSNEREMVYLNADFLTSQLLNSFLAHEFTHLISFNQKERLRGILEDVWLNEARAEFAPTLLDYDLNYDKSNLKTRVIDFLQSPNDSLTDWQGQESDYGSASLFLQYLAEKYGQKIITNSMEAASAGFESLNYALKKWNATKTIKEIFADFLVAVYENNCSLGEAYCFENQNLASLNITPSLIFLSPSQKKEFFVDFSLKPWAGKWYRILATDGDLRIVLTSKTEINYQASYLLCDLEKECHLFSAEVKDRQAEIFIPDFALNYNSLTLISAVEPLAKTLNEDQKEPFFDFSLQVKIENTQEEKDLITDLQKQIALLQAEIAQVQAKIQALLLKDQKCSFSEDLFFGASGFEVKCLQSFLAERGKDIYPEAIVSGYFGLLTKKAVTRFQEKYKEEILAPFGLQTGNGYVGKLTRAKISALMAQ